MRHTISILSALMIFIAAGAQARDLGDATNQLCEKIKACGQQEIAKQDIPPEMRQMMEGMFSGMCQSMIAPYVVSAQQAGLESKAIACIESIETKSCDDLMQSNGAQTEACQELEAAAEKAYPEGDPTK